MALNFETVRTDIYDWVASIVGGSVTVIFENQNGPRPSLPYVSILLTTLTQIGVDYISPPDAMGDSDIIGDREFNIRIQAYGGDPITQLENIRSSLQKPSVLDTLRANNIVFVDRLSINSVSALLDTEWEARASMDILFRIAQTDSDELGLIETVEVDETLSDGVSDIYTATVTISSP